ncbi:nucleotidyltransferase domain-containing protein [Paucisalibacillus sp. EB02]|uniref:nucleotidyltransferase domain-containing protein n=1 Tax=Paucisalibacillus sp. EB02 TaxID=1347087 RepID=UPI0006941A5A|nr:nucleotidyltransferase domain-containing protein [Paucisalibacillus sp. EB02]
MRLPSMEAALRFIIEEHPECEIAFLAGSASKGEETATSDLDIVVFDHSIESSYRESFILYGWKVETFIHNEDTYLKQFDSERSSGRPILANMLSEGKIIKDNGKADEIKNRARMFIQTGPNPLTEEFIRASRYFIFDLLDDFIDAKSHEEAVITLNTMTTQLAEFILRVNGRWSGRGKGLVRALKNFDEEIYISFFDSLDRYYKHQDKDQIVHFVNEFYEPLGGPLFHGFKQGDIIKKNYD